MKRTLVKSVIVFCLMTIGPIGIAQDGAGDNGSGIYLTESDFLQNKVTLYAKSDAFNYLERSLDDVILMRSGNKYKLSKGSFYGYLKQGDRYRFYEDDAKFPHSYGYYKVEEQSGVVIYSKESATPKTGTHTWYYYSETLNSPVKKLSMKSLKHVSDNAYPVMIKYALIRSGKNFVRLDK